MAKKHKHEEHVNHEAWAIPYGDLVTLLLAFFVVMYSISSVNEGKYRVLSQSMVAAFHGKPKSMTPIQVGAQPVSGSQMSLMDGIRPAAPATDLIPRSAAPGIPQLSRSGMNPERVAEQRDAQGQAMRELQALASAIEQAMAPLIDEKLIVVRRNRQWLEVEIRTDILFPSGVATITPSAHVVLDELSTIFARFNNSIRVEGYTDDRPINTLVFPSNWELSAARAASVVRRFAEHGVAPDRLGIIGWGEQRPAASNDSAEGRNQNRRVLIVVLGSDLQQRAISDLASRVRDAAGTGDDDGAAAVATEESSQAADNAAVQQESGA
ncbi:MAG: flagellar motor protein MotD [Lysobacterales bacterium CG17_big_fil_post_rev_8_21_14_2_50_64_11]|nr:MAG: flagellar motor protein MotD [Xanthomonadales bacterium CG17_big_fil_post_rev_8_21_14_2_50_64_11]PIX59953.1 MAG: flagellar motor protein MotD [Xanthomonadales bacterium CG_4_10_14_3_um_filter_64_11]